MRIRNPGFAKGTFYAFMPLFRNWAKKKGLFARITDHPAFECLDVFDSKLKSIKSGDAVKHIEKHPIVAGVGHVCEYVLENNKCNFFHASLLELMAELKTDEESEVQVVHSPRALEWEMVADVTSGDAILTHGLVESEIKQMFRWSGKEQEAQKDLNLPRRRLAPTEWLTEYVYTILFFVADVHKGTGEFEFQGLSHFFQVQWPLLFDELCMVIVVQINQSSAPIINDQIAMLNSLNIQVDLVMSFDHSLMQLDHLGCESRKQIVHAGGGRGIHCPSPSITFMFYTAGDIIATARWTPVGTRCLFNGGSLLTVKTLSVKMDLLERLRALVFERQLRLGIYVNDEHISEKALQMLIELCNKCQDVFSIGFCYGGVNGILTTHELAKANDKSGGDLVDLWDTGLGVHYLAGRNDNGNWRLV